MTPAAQGARRALGVAVRVIMVSIVLGLLAFALGLLAGIVSLGIANALGKQVSMAGAYRYFALPAGIFGVVVAFFGMLVAEIRQRKRARRPG